MPWLLSWRMAASRSSSPRPPCPPCPLRCWRRPCRCGEVCGRDGERYEQASLTHPPVEDQESAAARYHSECRLWLCHVDMLHNHFLHSARGSRYCTCTGRHSQRARLKAGTAAEADFRPRLLWQHSSAVFLPSLHKSFHTLNPSVSNHERLLKSHSPVSMPRLSSVSTTCLCTLPACFLTPSLQQLQQHEQQAKDSGAAASSAQLQLLERIAQDMAADRSGLPRTELVVG